ncbi:MAG TPA: outer membrane lipoprotein-sorting protein [Deltaproteobacteria bacterium]|nr:outer membrane lipoprotein-sorting protein [Deltaproteobacteria bacterium]
MKYRLLVGFLLVVVLLCVFAVASTGMAMTGDEVLAKVDAVLSASDNSLGEATMTLIDKDGDEKERKLKIWTKHYKDKDDWSILKFLTPAEIRDLGFLSLSDDQMYLYLPAFDRVRRIASHARKESFAGSDLSNDDLSTGKYTDHYDAQIAQETETQYVLELTRKPGSDRIYPRVVAWVDKGEFTASKMELYDDQNNLWKTNEIENEKIQGYWTPRQITMKDVQKDHTTIMKITKIQYDTDLDDNVFTKRYLKRRLKGD